MSFGQPSDGAAVAVGALQGKVALVTGAGRGIGREIALLMAREGARVLVNDVGASVSGEGVDSNCAAQVVEEISAAGGQAVAHSGDASMPTQATDMVQSALEAFGRLDIVVNNAGILRKAAFTEISYEAWQALHRVNLDSAFLVSQAAARVFQRQQAGAFVHMTSTAGLIGAAEQAHYCSSKLAIAALSKSIALELGAQGIRSNCISPIAATRMMVAATGRALDAPGQLSANSVEGVAAIAPLAGFLASDLATTVNGQIIGARGNDVYLFNQPRPQRLLQRSDGWTIARLSEVMEPAWRNAWVPLERTRDVLNWVAS